MMWIFSYSKLNVRQKYSMDSVVKGFSIKEFNTPWNEQIASLIFFLFDAQKFIPGGIEIKIIEDFYFEFDNIQRWT